MRAHHIAHRESSRRSSSQLSTTRRRFRVAVAELLEPRRLLAAIASGQTISSSISPGSEVESYTFNGTVGGSIIVTVGDTSGNAFYPLVELFTPTGTRLAAGSGQVGASVANYALP